MNRRLVGACVAVLALVFVVAGCSGTGTPGAASSAVPSTVGTGTRTFTDDAGRQVQLPADIQRVAPSGAQAQLVLFSLCPDKMVGLASSFSGDQFQYLDKKYQSLPVFGSFYSGTLNMEAVMAAAPQVIIDIGDTKPDNVSDLDGIQQRTGIPTVFIQMTLSTLDAAYARLAQVTGDGAQASAITSYLDQTLGGIAQKVATIPAAQRPSVYYGQNDGLTATVAGTSHTQVIDLVGATNVAQVAGSSNTASISMEQLMVWNPDVILLAPGDAYASVATAPAWQGLSAMQTGKFYEIPAGPYNWMDQPPSINQVLGAVWLANLLYPDVFTDDMVTQAQTFYSLFYHCTLTDDQARALLADSTLKR